MGEEGGWAGKTQPSACAPCCFPGRVPSRTHAKPWQTAPLRTLWFLGGAKAPCGEAAAGFHRRERCRPGDFPKLFQPRACAVFGCRRFHGAFRRCTWIERWWSWPQETRHSRTQGGSFAGPSSPALSAGPESRLGGPRPLRPQERHKSLVIEESL